MHDVSLSMDSDQKCSRRSLSPCVPIVPPTALLAPSLSLSLHLKSNILVAFMSEKNPLVFFLLFLRLANHSFARPLMQSCHMRSPYLALIQLLRRTSALTSVVQRLVLLRRHIDLRLLVSLSHASYLMESGSPVNLNVTRSALMAVIQIWQSRTMLPRTYPIFEKMQIETVTKLMVGS